MASPIVQFVDSPSTTATLRYDFNVSTPTLKCYPLQEGIDLGTPSFTGEPEGVGGFYGYRSMQFRQRIVGTRAVALARMSLLAKEMLRAQNWLRFQWDISASPVFFKTYHTEPGAMSLENAGSADAWDIVVPLEADGFAYGPRQTITQAQVIQGPADLTGPTRTAMRLVLPTIKGDALTPLRVTISPASAGSANNALSDSSWLIGCISGSASMTDSILDIGTGDTVTNVSGTSAAAADATYFGGSYRTVTIGGGTNLVNRFTMTVPNTIQPGRYKVLLRCRYTGGEVSSKPHVYRLQQQVASGAYTSNGPSATITVVNADTKREYWVDLGEATFPFGVNPPSDAGGTMPSSTIAIQIGTSDGSASFTTVDSVKLIPVDGPTVTSATILKVAGSGVVSPLSATVYGTFDGDAELYWAKTTSGVYIESKPALRGGFPVADPAAAQNLLVVMALDSGTTSVTGTNYITTLNAQAAVDVSYYPRYLYIGDGT
jgi:hypothetical protein